MVTYAAAFGFCSFYLDRATVCTRAGVWINWKAFDVCINSIEFFNPPYVANRIGDHKRNEKRFISIFECILVACVQLFKALETGVH